MAKDYTKYNVEGVGSNLSKARLVQAIVKDYIAKNAPNWETLQTAFPDSIQGSKGLVAKKDAGVKERDFYMDAPFTLSDGTEIVTCRQWGAKNIADFLDLTKKLGYSVSADSGQAQADLNDSKSFSLSNDIYSGDIRDHIEDILTSRDKERCQLFKKSVIDFINTNHASYWIIPFVIDCLVDFQGKSDNEELDWDELIEELSVAGTELDYNPKKKYCLFYDTFDEAFKADEDEDLTEGFFDLIMELHFSSSSDFNSLTTEQSDIFYNTCISTLYCTICSMCQDDIAQHDLVDGLVSIIEDEFVTKFEAGDLVWSIIEETLVALGVDLEEFEEEDDDLWRDLYKYNFDGIVEELFDNDVFDNDYIPS